MARRVVRSTPRPRAPINSRVPISAPKLIFSGSAPRSHYIVGKGGRIPIRVVRTEASSDYSRAAGTANVTKRKLKLHFILQLFSPRSSVDQLWAARPVLGYGDYRTPLKNLYLCGSGAHPGGGVIGVPGHNAAREILRDGLSNRVSRPNS